MLITYVKLSHGGFIHCWYLNRKLTIGCNFHTFEYDNEDCHHQLLRHVYYHTHTEIAKEIDSFYLINTLANMFFMDIL